MRPCNAFTLSCWKQGASLIATAVYLPPSPSLDNFFAVFCWTVPPLPTMLILLQPRALSRTSARQEVLSLLICLSSHPGFSDGKALFVLVKAVFAIQFSTARAGRLQSCLSFLPSSSLLPVAVATEKPHAAPAFHAFCSVISGAGHSLARRNLFSQHPANACCLGAVCAALIYDKGITK